MVRPILARAGEINQFDVGAVEGVPVAGRVRAQKLLHGEKGLLVKLWMDRGAITPAHRHNHESYLYVLKGRIRSTVGGQAFDLGPGDAILHPMGVEHMCEALEESMWIEVKAPPKESLHPR